MTGIRGAGRPEFPQPAREGCLLFRQQKVSGATRGGSERIFYGGENIGGCPRLSRSRYRPCTDFAAAGRGTMTSHHLHPGSDATGETINSVPRSSPVPFGAIEPIAPSWPPVPTPAMPPKVCAEKRRHGTKGPSSLCTPGAAELS